MAILRKRQIENLHQLSGEELGEFLASLPITKEEMEAMFEFIEDELYETECDDTAKFAMQFMLNENLPFPKILAWLNANGGHCDCKIMQNIECEWRKAFPED
ncbi:MAG TPA: DUF2695 domain-containing protein [Pyrinomonadaceae bacterium]|nr:DUF2695 domain-containing protein [Pyrinomonadaceae bacterium]